MAYAAPRRPTSSLFRQPAGGCRARERTPRSGRCAFDLGREHRAVRSPQYPDPYVGRSCSSLIQCDSQGGCLLDPEWDPLRPIEAGGAARIHDNPDRQGSKDLDSLLKLPLAASDPLRSGGLPLWSNRPKETMHAAICSGPTHAERMIDLCVCPRLQISARVCPAREGVARNDPWPCNRDPEPVHARGGIPSAFAG